MQILGGEKLLKNLLKSAGEIFLSGLRGAKTFSVAFRIVFRIFLRVFQTVFRIDFKSFSGAISFCRHAALTVSGPWLWLSMSSGPGVSLVCSARRGTSEATTSRPGSAQIHCILRAHWQSSRCWKRGGWLQQWEPAQWQQNFSTIKFGLSKFYCRGVSHEKKNSVLDDFPLCPQGHPPQKAKILFLLSSRCLWNRWVLCFKLHLSFFAYRCLGGPS